MRICDVGEFPVVCCAEVRMGIIVFLYIWADSCRQVIAFFMQVKAMQVQNIPKGTVVKSVSGWKRSVLHFSNCDSYKAVLKLKQE